MSERPDSGALTVLWVVAVAAATTFLGFTAYALSREPGIAAYGVGGLCTGALLASLISMSRRRGGSREPTTGEVLADRMQALELDRERMLELEERLDFAERLLAEHQQLGRRPAEGVAQLEPREERR